MDNTSPFRHLLGTNHAVTSKREMQQLRSILSELIPGLTPYQEKMNHAAAAFNKAHRQHSKLAQIINKHLALMAPIRRIPVDVIREIFLNCLPQEHNAIMDYAVCPLVLTHVCSSWRRIALDSTALWTAIHIPIPIMPDPLFFFSARHPARARAKEVALERAHMITEWLGRSGSRTLGVTLFIESYIHANTSGREITDTIINAVIPFAERWGTLVCNGPTCNFKRIAELPSSALPRLHTVAFGGFDNQGHSFWANSGIMRAPQLRNLAYSRIAEDITQLDLPFARLTNLSLYGHSRDIIGEEIVSDEKLRQLLSMCPGLISCRLDVPGLFTDARLSPVSLPHLRRLFIVFLENETNLFLDCPVLETLEIYGKGPEILRSFLQGIGHQLRNLAFDPRPLSRSQFDALMRACTELVQLTFNFVCLGQTEWGDPNFAFIFQRGAQSSDLALDDQLLELMTPRQMKNGDAPTACAMLPKLVTLEFNIPGDFSSEKIMALINARLPQLKTLHVQIKQKVEFAKLDCERLTDCGFNLRVRYDYVMPPLPERKTLFLAIEGVARTPEFY